MSRDELSKEEKDLFQQLERETIPPAALENKILNELKNQGEINTPTTMNIYVKWAASVAAAFLLFFGGMYFGKTNAPQTAEIQPTLGYMLLLHEDSNFKPGDPMAMFEEYSAWMENTMNSGVTITGQELKPEATLVTMEGQSALDQNAATRTTGYFILEASSYEEAVQIAEANPHVKYGGSVEVKPFMVR